MSLKTFDGPMPVVPATPVTTCVGQPCSRHPKADHEEACCPAKTIWSAKDQLYNFRWRYKAEQHDIHSKRQFERVAKARGLVPIVADDVLKNGEPYKPKHESVARRPEVQAVIRQVAKDAKTKLRR